MFVTDRYKPYNFSSSHCFVTSLEIDNTIKKIEEKLPPTAKKLKGVFVSCRAESLNRLLGVINLNFNDGALKPCNIPVVNLNYVSLTNTRPIFFDEDLKPHSLMSGYYRDFGQGGLNAKIKIYIHYTE